MDTKGAKNVAAWALKKNQRPFTVSAAPYTAAPKGHVVVQVSHVAINPIDWILQDGDFFGLKYPAVFGLDVTGEIVEVGKGVSDLRAGQRVIAITDAYSAEDPSHGGFQKYAVVSAGAVAELPATISEEKGVVLPLGVTTAAAGLYQKDFLALPYPESDGKPDLLGRTVVIWGGSSSVGSCAIQLAVASGAEVFTTASPNNFDYCKKLGATKCFDYHKESVEDDVVEALKGKTCAGAFHAVGSGDAVQTCARIVDRSKGKAIVVTVRGVPDDGIPKSVQAKSIASTTVFSNGVGHHIWRKFLPKALAEGTIVPKPDPLVAGEGLNSVQHGLDKQKAGVSAVKVVIAKIQGDSGTQPPL